MDLHFHYDISCPYAYLASTQVEALAARTGAALHWRPVLLGGLLQAVGGTQDLVGSMNSAKARLNLLDLLRQADLLGVPLKLHPRHPVRTVNAMRLLLAADAEQRPALTHALYRAYWVDNLDLSDPATLAELARQHGLDAEVATDPQVRRALYRAVDEALQAGLFGVPTFTVGDRLWWGVDRLPFVERALGGEPPARAHLAGQVPSLVFFHDFSSPFSYLGSTQIERVAAEAGARVEWVPILLGALFRDIGTPEVPLLQMNPSRQRWTLRDLHDWAAHWGVPFDLPGHFPFRTVTALRVAVQAPATTPVIYRAGWADNRDLSDPEVLAAILDEAGFDGRALIEGTADPQVKDTLRANTLRAQQAGVCGVPTTEVAGDLYWGQDRLWMVEQALRGWRLPSASL